MRRFMGGRVVVLLVVSSLITAACSSGTSPSDLIQVREGHTATLLENGQVLVVGGHGGQRVGFASPELFDPATGWSPASVTSQGREEHTATLLLDGHVLVAGGFIDPDRRSLNSRPTNEAEVYDSSTNMWSPTGSMAEVRGMHTATLLRDGRVLVVGGSAGLAEGLSEVVLASAELYDPAIGTWSEAASMAEGRARHAATLLADGRVLVLGGERLVPGDEPDTIVDSPITSVEVYDPSSNSWSSAGSMSGERVDTATLLQDGRVLVVGEEGDPQQDRDLSSVEVYDPSTGTWSKAAPMENEGGAVAATLLNDGRVLIVGDSTAEAYSPVTDSWSRAGKLRKARGGFTATLLAEGRVLIAGGAGEGGERPSLTEVFDPTTNSWKPAAEQQ